MAERSFYPKRNGEYVYDLDVSKDDTTRLFRRYRAHLSNADRIENGQLTPVQVDLLDAYGPTVSDARLALDAGFDAWRQAQFNRISVMARPREEPDQDDSCN
jgi:hypothetical protein